jgi:hypothetical protein
MTSQSVYRPSATIRGATTDPYRYENRVRCRIEIDALQMMVGDGIMLKRGENVADIPESEVPRIKARLRDPVKWAAAETAFEDQLAEWQAEHGNRPCPYAISVPAAYRTIYRKDPGCVLSFKVLEEGIAPPLTDEDARLAALHAKTLETARRFTAEAMSDDEESTPVPRKRNRTPRTPEE